MENLYRISVLIIFYNEEKILDKTLKRILAMDYPKKLLEIVCVDDGSTDNSPSIARKYNLKLIQQKNMGRSYSYQKGVENCSGDIVLSLDAHTLLKNKNSFLVLNDYFRRYQKLAGVFGRYTCFDKKDKNFIRDIRRYTVFNKDAKEKIISLQNFTTSSTAITAYKRSVLKKIKFPESFTNSYGWDTFIQILLHNQGFEFLYTPRISGIHDAQINYRKLITKMGYEIRATGNILLAAGQKKCIFVPYLNYYLSFPLGFILALTGFFLLPRLFSIPLVTFAFIEVWPSIKVFSAFGYSLNQRLMAFLYLLIKEFIQGIYLPFYLATKLNHRHQLVFILKTALYWEFCKLENAIRHLKNITYPVARKI